MKIQFNSKLSKLLLASLLIALAIVLAYSAPSMILAAPATLANETFTNSTAAGWTLSNSACLTAGSNSLACVAAPNNEGNGNGWLRLTSATGDQRASAIYNTAFSSSNGVQIQFQYATYGGTGADGISFYLIDGATGAPTTGAAGGGLGYSFNTVDPIGPGVTNGYVGIGLDEYGNFGNTGYSSAPCFGPSTNSGITIIGSGNLNSGFNCLQHFSTGTVPTTNRAGAKWVRITIAPGATSMTVQTSPNKTTWTTVIAGFNLASASGQVALPSTFKMGFSGSTGGSTNFHEIRYLTVTGANPSTTSVACAPNPSTIGQSVTCTASIAGNPQIGGNIPSGTCDFYDGTTFISTGTLNGSAQATYTTSAFTLGAHTITCNYNGDSIYSASNGNTVQQVNKSNPSVTTKSSPNPSTYGQSVTLTCTVTGNNPTGTVTFSRNGTTICNPVNLVNGIGTCATSTLPVGTDPILCAYSGDANNSAVNAAIYNHLVNDLPKEVPEGDTLLLLGGGMSGLGVWLRYQWSKRRPKK